MLRKLYRLMKELGVHRIFVVSLLLRLPFDFLNTVLASNMLSSFISLIEKNQKDRLMSTFLLFLGLSALLFAYNMTIWSTISLKVNILLQKRIRRKMFLHLLGSEYKDVLRFSSGEWINRMNSDIDRLHGYLMMPVNFMHMVIAMFNMILSAIVLGFLNLPLMIMSVLILVPFSILSSVVVVRKIPIFRRRAQEEFGKYTNWAGPITASADTIEVFDGEEFVLKKIEETSLSILSENMKAHRASGRAAALNTLCGTSGYILLLLCGDSMMGTTIADLSQLLKITQYRGAMMMSTMIINSSVNNMRGNRAGAERVLEVFEGA